MTDIKAVIFDIGGVCVGSPFLAIAEYEQRHGLPRNYINVSIEKQGEQGAFQRLERGEIRIPEFYELFGNELSDPTNREYYRDFMCLKGGPPAELPENISIDGRELFRNMISATATIDRHMLEVLKRLRASGRFRLAALTNNFHLPADELSLLGASYPAELRELFHEFLESKELGMRKPDPRIYMLACEKLDVKPNEAVFLDDIGKNLKAAAALGMQTIKVEPGKSEKAISDLETIVGIPLLDHKYHSKF